MPRQPPSPPHLATDLADQPAELHTTSQVRTLLAETQALSARLAALHEVATAMQSSLDTATVLSTLAREARWVLDFQYCSVAEVIEGGYSERVLLSVTAPTSDAPQQRSLAEGGPVADAIRAEHALLLPQLDQQPNIPPGMASALIVPLRSRGTIIGTLNFFSTQERHYRIDDMRIAGALAAQAAVVIQNTQLFAELTSAHDELQTILESISDGVIVVLEDYTILLVNNAARAILMLPPVPMAGKRPTALLQGRRPDGRRLVTRRQLVQLRAQARSTSEDIVQLSNGRHLEWRRTPIQVARARGEMITLRDITTRVQLDELRNDMMAMLVHDLRSPLTTLLLSLDLQASPHTTDDDQHTLRERMRESARQMLRQVNTLLDLRKFDDGRLELQREPTFLDYIIITVLATFQVQARFASVALQSEIASDLPMACVDSPLITRVLENLVGNALKFTDRGGTVTVRASYHEHFITICVEDTGIGVPSAFRDTIFEKYTQASGAQKSKGSGLGLAFCKLVIEAHQGQIALRENPGGGSIFWFRLPHVPPGHIDAH